MSHDLSIHIRHQRDRQGVLPAQLLDDELLGAVAVRIGSKREFRDPKNRCDVVRPLRSNRDAVSHLSLHP